VYQPRNRPLDPQSPAGAAATVSLGNALDQIAESIRLREALVVEPVRIRTRPAVTAKPRRKAA
jgi:hypothetical protein